MAEIKIQGKKVKKLNAEEKKAIRALQKLADIWPKSLWLFSASGKLCVMQYDKDGERPESRNGGNDIDYLITDVDIDNDGGDW